MNIFDNTNKNTGADSMKYKRKKLKYQTYSSSVNKSEKRVNVGKICSSGVIAIFFLFMATRAGVFGVSKIKQTLSDSTVMGFVADAIDYVNDKTKFVSELGKKGAEFCFGYLRGDSEEKEKVFARDEALADDEATDMLAGSDAAVSSDAATQSKAEKKFLPVVPCAGEISSPYGERSHPINGEGSFHNGVDISANSGDEVVAADDGIVEKSTYNQYSGNFVVIRHLDNYTTSYAHLSKAIVKAGDRVSKGEPIGYVGSTGISTGPHLHWEIRNNGEPVDPSEWFGGEVQ